MSNTQLTTKRRSRTSFKNLLPSQPEIKAQTGNKQFTMSKLRIKPMHLTNLASPKHRRNHATLTVSPHQTSREGFLANKKKLRDQHLDILNHPIDTWIDPRTKLLHTSNLVRVTQQSKQLGFTEIVSKSPPTYNPITHMTRPESHTSIKGQKVMSFINQSH